jgi:glycosyltransferase involved in cell wall biosynthesis
MILANSRFTATWLQRRWGKAAEVLYPPVELDPPTVDKKNLIVSVGRITGDPRNKNQLEQVRAFREFVSGVGIGWTLRIIGSCRLLARDRDYLETIQREARGLPVELLVNVDRTVTLRSLAESKLFWHTTGLLTDENERPEHAEHFGIATVEAMRAGCVPIVIASGGQREIVENGVSGFLVQDLDELARQSVTLARDVSLSSRMSEEARRRSEVFNGNSFDKRFKEVLSQCLSN